MSTHTFIFSPGLWLGQGEIKFSTSHEKIHFFTKWMVEPEQDGLIICSQQVEMRGNDEILSNRYVFSNLTKEGCLITIENELVNSVQGRCLFQPKMIAWEFRGHETMEGFEVYELQENGEYQFHGEYSDHDHFRTVIDGRIWQKKG